MPIFGNNPCNRELLCLLRRNTFGRRIFWDCRNSDQSFAENIKYLVCADIYSVDNGRRTFLCTFVARNKQSACNDYDWNNYAFDTRNSNRKRHS